MDNHDRYEADDDGFPPQEDMDALLMEKTVIPHESDVDLTYRLFEQSAPFAAQRIIFLATHASSERIRLDAAKYIVDRVLGRLGDMTAAHHALTISDQITDRVEMAINRILDDMELTPEQQARISEVVPRRMRELAQSGAGDKE